MFRSFRSSTSRALVRALFCVAAAPVIAVAAMLPVHDQPPAPAPASGASGTAPVSTAFDVLTDAPVELGAPDSPRASLAHYFDAARAGRWDAAARYLVLDTARAPRGAELARRLKAVIDDTGWIDLDTISDAHAGRLNDGLAPDIEEVARFRLDGRNEALRLQRRTDARGPHWAFSAATVTRVDSWYDALPDRWLRETLVAAHLQVLLRPGPLELLWWQWLVMSLLLVVAWGAGRLLGRATRWALARVAARTATSWDDELIAALAGPLGLAWTLLLLQQGSRHLWLLKPAARLVDGLMAAAIVFTCFWALWHAAGVAVRHLLAQPWARQSGSARTLVSVGGNLARGTLIFAGVLAVLSSLGYPIGTLLAGLGIGGLALAFGAQKTIENLFGSVAIALDQPFSVGDLVTVDGVTGVVESIGLRSTRLRTPDRTLVSIPNGKLADQRSESLAARDCYRFATTLGLDYDTSRAQMGQVLDGVDAALRAHPRIAMNQPPSVRFSGLGESTLDIEVLAWFDVRTSADFVQCREQALLAIMDVVEQAGTTFAYPTRTVQFAAATAALAPAAQPAAQPTAQSAAGRAQ